MGRVGHCQAGEPTHAISRESLDRDSKRLRTRPWLSQSPVVSGLYEVASGQTGCRRRVWEAWWARRTRFKDGWDASRRVEGTQQGLVDPQGWIDLAMPPPRVVSLALQTCRSTLPTRTYFSHRGAHRLLGRRNTIDTAPTGWRSITGSNQPWTGGLTRQLSVRDCVCWTYSHKYLPLHRVRSRMILNNRTHPYIHLPGRT